MTSNLLHRYSLPTSASPLQLLHSNHRVLNSGTRCNAPPKLHVIVRALHYDVHDVITPQYTLQMVTIDCEYITARLNVMVVHPKRIHISTTLPTTSNNYQQQQTPNYSQCPATETAQATTAPSRVRTLSTATLATYVPLHSSTISSNPESLTAISGICSAPARQEQRRACPLAREGCWYVSPTSHLVIARTLTNWQLLRASMPAAAATRPTRPNPRLLAMRLRSSKHRVL